MNTILKNHRRKLVLILGILVCALLITLKLTVLSIY